MTDKKSCPKCYSRRSFPIKWAGERVAMECVKCDHQWNVSMTRKERISQ